MAGDEQDPFSWDTDRLVQELCIGNPSWFSPPSTLKLPKPAALEKMIRDHEHDGRSFLTYADDLGIPEFWRNLNISNMRHQQSLHHILIQLRRSSRQYKHWKKEKERQQAESEDTDDDTPATAKSGQAHPLPADIHSPPTDTHPPLGTQADSQPQAPTSAKKRMAPTLVDTNPVFSRAFLTEADVLLNHGQQEDQPEASTLGSGMSPDDFLSAHLNNIGKSYLGPSLKVDYITEAPGPDADADETDTICWVRQQALPPGRRLQVARSVKRLLLQRAAPDLDKDKILPDFGESDDEFDEETWKEIEAERREREAAATHRAAKQATLNAMSPEELLDKIVKDLERDWASKKKCKHDYSARELWDTARLSGDREAQVERAKNLEAKLSARAITLRKKLIEESWFDENDEAKREKLARGFLGATIEDRELARWKIRILQSLAPPPKRATLTKPLARAPRIPKQVDDDDDGDTISDDSDRGGYLSDRSIHDEPVPESDAMQVDPDTGSQPMQLDSETESESDPMAESPSLPTMPVKSEGPPRLATPARLRGQAARPIYLDSSPVVILDEARPDLRDIKKIQEIGDRHWQKLGDRQRLTIAVFCGWPEERYAMVAEVISKYSASEVWDRHIAPLLPLEDRELSQLARDTVDFALVRLFDCYIGNTADRCRENVWLTARLRKVTCQRIYREEGMFSAFHALLHGAIESTPEAKTPEPHRGTPLEPFSSIRRAPAEVDVGEEEEEEEPDVNEMVRKTFGSESPDVQSQSSGRRSRVGDPRAARLIRTTCSQGKTFKERGLKLQVQLQSEAAQAQSLDDGFRFIDRARLVVNLSKDPDDALIYINDHIGAKIKDHQIEGVRFMWNNIVKSSLGQGCLLAHEMGLGKTMQTITLLTVITGASASKDEAVVRQIPPRLRESRTLVICPAGLVDNWVCEFAEWAPDQLLGPCFKLDAQLDKEERMGVVTQWAQQGGILICSYDIYAAMSGMRAGKHQNEDSIKIMRSNANIAITDEAHYLKNIKTQRAAAVANIETTSRIALTGSPLTKYVMNYYALINWAAPGYLGDVSRFMARFNKPIEAGLWCDSAPADRRKSRKQLAVLKALVEPIVHRNDAKVLRETLPAKREFIIGLKLTPTQLNAYSAYIKSIRSITKAKEFTHMAKVWSLVTYLSALVGHPVIFKRKLEEKKTNQAGIGKGKTLKKKKKKKGVDDTDDEGEDAELSNDIISEMLAHVNDRTIEDVVHSNKMRILFRILDESKQVGDKVLIFSQSLMALDYLQNVFTRQQRNFSRMDGDTKASSRQKSVQDFNEDPNAEIYLISTTTGCIGLNITGANRVVIFDFKYTPADEQQAIARSYRIGQMKAVYVYWLTVAGTFEQTLHSSAIFKKQLAQRVVDKQNPDPTSSKLKDYFKLPELPGGQDLTSFRGQDHILDVLIRDFAGDIISITPTETYEREEVFEFDEDDHRDMERDFQELKQQATAPGPHGANQYNGGVAGLGPAQQTGPPIVGALHRGPRSTQPVNGDSGWHARRGGLSPQPAPARKLVPYTGPLPSARPGPHAPIAQNAGPGPSTQPAPTRAGPSARPGGLASGFSLSPSPPSGDPFVSSSSTAGPSVVDFSGFLRPANRPKVGSESSKAGKVAISPILAAGTHVLKPPQSRPEPVADTDKHLYDTLAGFYRMLATRGLKSSLLEPKDIVKGIADGLRRFGHATGLPKMSKMQLIQGQLAKQRFSEALLFGYLKPDIVVAALEGGDLDSMAKMIEDMSTEEFQAKVQGQEGRDVGAATL
ncbi:SNF2 family N-terminal domain-containing protein [Schizothecium vesticola]|uniref:SNF2 family N-terminal domain-containing protein n=1 Tax=Schizothecium vesticola TaxID=314040 RepID=A0AA40EH22_9PEZI|nr:SNF2 family N-terminal domain-containing protein [Schizothecium vesticola]